MTSVYEKMNLYVELNTKFKAVKYWHSLKPRA